MALRKALAFRKQAHLPWDDTIYEVLIAQVCRNVHTRWDADTWPTILREQLPVWRSAYQRSGRALALSADLAR